MPVADWTLEKKPGEPWEYNTPLLTYNASMFDGLTVKFNSLGEETEWVNEAA